MYIIRKIIKVTESELKQIIRSALNEALNKGTSWMIPRGMDPNKVKKMVAGKEGRN